MCCHDLIANISIVIIIFCILGRSNNIWLSPLGSACFSLQLHVPLDSPLGKTLPLIQHLVMVSVITAIKEKRGYKVKLPSELI